jgi:hypothetical protein
LKNKKIKITKGHVNDIIIFFLGPENKKNIFFYSFVFLLALTPRRGVRA